MYILLALPGVVFLLLIGVISLIFKKVKFAFFLFGLAFGLNWWTESIPVHWDDPYERNDSTLRVMTYNTCVNGDYFRNSTDSLHGIINFVYEQDPDILVLQEYDWTFDKGVFGKALMKRWPYNTKSLGSPLGRTDVIYSKYPLSDFTKVQPRTYSVSVAYGDRNIFLVCSHLKSNNVTDSIAFRFENYKSILEERYEIRAQQTEVIAEHIKEHAGQPVLVCGDLNDVCGSKAVRTLQKSVGLRDAWWEKGLGPGFTYYAKHLFFRLDHILFSDDFHVKSVKVPEVYFSDHYPLIADFEL